MDFIIGFANDVISGIIGGQNILGGPNRNPPNCTFLDNWIFEDFILANEPFTKALQIFETCVLVNNNLCGKLVSSLEFRIKFDERFKVTSVPLLISDFNLLSCKLGNFTFNVLSWVVSY